MITPPSGRAARSSCISASSSRLAQAHGDSLEQRKTAWLARAYASEADCRNDPPRARGQLDAVLAQMQLALPEGGAVPREVQSIRKACLAGIARR